MATPHPTGDKPGDSALKLPAGPLVVNAENFTRLKQIAEGRLEPSSLERLGEYLFAPEGELHYRIEGRAVLGPDGVPLRRLVLAVRGWVMLQCHLTMQPLRHEINLGANLVLVSSEAELPPLEAESDDEDYIVADREIDLAALVEDEVILDLPMIPTAAGTAPEESGEESDKDAGKPSPFAVLAALKKTNT